MANTKNQECTRSLSNVNAVISTLNEVSLLYESASASAHEALTLISAYAGGDPVNYIDPDGRFASYAYQTTGETVINALNNPHVQGSLQAFSGLAEAGVGGGMAYASGGLAAPLGYPVMAQGFDHFFTGMRTAITGRRGDTVTSQLLQKTGMSPEWASGLDNGANFVCTLGGAGLIAAERDAVSLATLRSSSGTSSLLR